MESDHLDCCTLCGPESRKARMAALGGRTGEARRLTWCAPGQAKNVVSSLGGYFLLPASAGGGVGADKLVNIGGCAVGLLGSMWYACLKFRQRFPSPRHFVSPSSAQLSQPMSPTPTANQ